MACKEIERRKVCGLRTTFNTESTSLPERERVESERSDLPYRQACAVQQSAKRTRVLLRAHSEESVLMDSKAGLCIAGYD